MPVRRQFGHGNAVLARQVFCGGQAFFHHGLTGVVHVDGFGIAAQFARRFGDADGGFIKQRQDGFAAPDPSPAAAAALPGPAPP